MDKDLEEIIHKKYEKIISGKDTLYGEPIDWNNHEMAVVAAYFEAKVEDMKIGIAHLNDVMKLLNGV